MVNVMRKLTPEELAAHPDARVRALGVIRNTLMANEAITVDTIGSFNVVPRGNPDQTDKETLNLLQLEIATKVTEPIKGPEGDAGGVITSTIYSRFPVRL